MSTSLARFNPFSGLRANPFSGISRGSPFTEIEDMWDTLAGTRDINPHEIRLDVAETDRGYTVLCDLPGCKRDDMKVSIDGDTVSLSAERSSESEMRKGDAICKERHYGRDMRTFRLAHEIDAAKADAKYVDGVLHLDLPKKIDSATSRKLLAIH